MDDKNGNIKAFIMIGDNNPDFLEAFAQMLEMRGYKTRCAGTPDDLFDKLRNNKFDLLTLDLDWGDDNMSGLELLKKVKAVDPFLPVIMITEHASIATAVEATRLGAFDYIEKIHDREKTFLVIKNAIESGRLRRQNQALIDEFRKNYEIVGQNSAMVELMEKIRLVAPTESIVLISGESGTGKELVARQIHYHSRRAERKFVTVDAGTLADNLAESELFGHRKGAFTGADRDRKGLFDEADGGTIFLDEISNTSLGLQAKLLGVVQKKEYRRLGENETIPCDVRIIAATNRDLPEMIEQGKFRDDLYYRLKIIELKIPPLRERKDDIRILTKHFIRVKSLRNFGREKHLTPEAVSLLLEYNWPGNVRELENSLERIVILSPSDEIDVHEMKSILGDIWLDQPGELKSLDEMTREFRKECILKAISLSEGKIARAAEVLQVHRTHLHKLINEYQLKEK